MFNDRDEEVLGLRVQGDVRLNMRNSYSNLNGHGQSRADEVL